MNGRSRRASSGLKVREGEDLGRRKRLHDDVQGWRFPHMGQGFCLLATVSHGRGLPVASTG